MLTDIEIAKSVKLRPINEVAAELGIHEDQVENYGRYIAKITTDKIDRNKFKNHHLILVTAISPTKAGNGKTTVSVGLALGQAAMVQNGNWGWSQINGVDGNTVKAEDVKFLPRSEEHTSELQSLS